jgi:hypothetical protein
MFGKRPLTPAELRQKQLAERNRGTSRPQSSSFSSSRSDDSLMEDFTPAISLFSSSDDTSSNNCSDSGSYDSGSCDSGSSDSGSCSCD